MNNRKKRTQKYTTSKTLPFSHKSKKMKRMRTTRRPRDLSDLPMTVRRLSWQVLGPKECSESVTPKFQSHQTPSASKSSSTSKIPSLVCRVCQILVMTVITLWLRDRMGHLVTGNSSPTSFTTRISTNGCKTIWHYERSASNKRKRMRRSGWTSWTRKKWQRKRRTLRPRRSILLQPPRWRHLTSWRDSWFSKTHTFRSSKWCRAGHRREIALHTGLLISRITSPQCHRTLLQTLQLGAPWSTVKGTTQGSRSHEQVFRQTSFAN